MEIVIRLDVLAQHIQNMKKATKAILLWLYSHTMILVGIASYAYLCYAFANWLQVY